MNARFVASRPPLLAVGVVVGSVVLGWQAQSFADTVTLKNGREIHGRLVEEGEHVIQIRTSGGTITIAKAEVATFSENENWGNYARPRTLEQTARAEAASNEEGRPRTPPGESPAPPTPSGSGADPTTPPTSAVDWEWAAGVTAEQQAALTPLRDQYLAQLEELGPPPEERLEAIQLSGDEERALREQIGRFDWRRRQGSANMRRRNAMEEVVDTFGVKATPQLVEALRSPSQWTARMSVQAIEKLAREGDRDQVNWLLYHFEVPDALVSLMDHQGEIDSPFIRREANQALEAMTGKSQGFKPSTEALRTPGETAAFRAWRDWWQQARTRWQAEQKEQAEKRTALLAKLEQVRKGQDPEDAASSQ